MLPGFSGEPRQQQGIGQRFSCTAVGDLPGAREIKFHFRNSMVHETDKHFPLHWSWVHHERLLFSSASHRDPEVYLPENWRLMDSIRLRLTPKS